MDTLSEQRWRELDPYLDEVLQLADCDRESWLAAMDETQPQIAEILRELLADDRAAEAEGFLDEAPRPLTPEAALPSQRVGPYRLVRPIGQGGMGRVWLAERTDGRFERRVAVKFLRAFVGGASERFKREGAILGRLKHPHVADLIDAGVASDGQPFLVLEHVEGTPIDEHCDARALGVPSRIRLFLDVLDAVADAHAKLIVHRDLKPSNVLVTSDGCVKLLDFGIAKLLDEEALGATQLTAEGVALTPQYAAPEQITGGPITTATDVFALGELLYLLLAGRHPVTAAAGSPADLMKAIVELEPQPMSDAVAPADNDIAASRGTTADKLRRQLRGELDTIVAAALKKHPSERYGSVAAFADDLRSYLDERPIRARPDSVRYRARKFARRNRTAVALVALALAATVAGVVATVVQARTARRQRDFALRQLARAERVNDLNRLLLMDAGPGETRLTVGELLDRAERIVGRADYSTDPAGYVHLLVAVGEQYAAREAYEQSSRVLEKAYQLSHTVDDPSAHARAACALAEPVDRRGQHARAVSLIEEGLRVLPQDSAFTPDRAFCLVRAADFGSLYRPQAEQLAALRLAERTLDATPLSSVSDRVLVLSVRAEVYSGVGRYVEAIATFKRAIDTLRRAGYDETKTGAEVFDGLGRTLLNTGRILEAEPYLRRVFQITGQDEAGNAAPAYVVNDYAVWLRREERLDEALTYVDRAYTKAQSLGDTLIAAQSLLKRSQIAIDQADFVRAATTLDRAERTLSRSLPAGHYVFGVILMERSRLARGLGNTSTALRLANEAIALTEAAVQRMSDGAHVLPNYLVDRSGLELETGNVEQAVADAARAVSLTRSWIEPGSFSLFVGRAHLALGRAQQAQGKEAEARVEFRSAAEQIAGSIGADRREAIAARRLADAEGR